MNCKDCGKETSFTGDDGQAYCVQCLCKRKRNPIEIDKRTGEWEGMY